MPALAASAGESMPQVAKVSRLQLVLGVGEGRPEAAGEGLVLGEGRVNADKVNAFVFQPP